MTLTEALAHITALQAQIDRQEASLRRDWLKISRLKRSLAYWRRMAGVTDEQAAKPSYRQRLIAEAEAIFKRGGE